MSRPYPSPIPAGLSLFSVRPAGCAHLRDRWPAGVLLQIFCGPAVWVRGTVGLGRASEAWGEPPRDPAGYQWADSARPRGRSRTRYVVPVSLSTFFSVSVFKTLSIFLLVATLSSCCFCRSLPFYIVFDCPGDTSAGSLDGLCTSAGSPLVQRRAKEGSLAMGSQRREMGSHN